MREQNVAVGILRRVDEDAARALEDEFFSKEYAYAAQKYKSVKEGCAERAEALAVAPMATLRDGAIGNLDCRRVYFVRRTLPHLLRQRC